MLQKEVRLFYSPTGVSRWHLWPRVALQAAALKVCVSAKRLSPLTRWLRVAFEKQRIWSSTAMIYVLLSLPLNQKQWEPVFTVSAWQQSLCRGLLLTEWQDAQIYFQQPSWLVWPFKRKINQLWQFLAVFFHIISMARIPIRFRCIYRVPVY